MARKKTHEEYVKEVSIKNSTIDVVDLYINASTKINHRCKICGHKWAIRPTHILDGIGCPECKRKAIGDRCRKTHEQYVDELSHVNPDIYVVGEYIDARTKIAHICKICGYKWYPRPYEVLRGKGCPNCKGIKIGNKLRKTHEEYVQELFTISPDIEVVDKYIDAKTPIAHRCKVCGYEWLVKPNHTLCGHGCPKCSQSLGEKTISKWLIDNDIFFIPQYSFDECKDKFSLPFDFYLPNYNTCIEFDGEQHFKAIDFFGGEENFKIRQLHDQIKTDYCDRHNICLLRIPFNKNIEEELSNFLFI